jgi:exopolyphosphatase/pppGpp-phosphohydrolase
MRLVTPPVSSLPPAPGEPYRTDPQSWLAWVDAAFVHDRPRARHLRGVWHRIASSRRLELAHLDDRRMLTLELAALVHDIGRAIDPEDHEPHAFVGARYLDSLGLHDVAALVAHHSGAKLEAVDREMIHLDVWPEVDRELLALLNYADRTVNAQGDTVSLSQRRADIAARLGADSASVRRFDAMLPELQATQLAFHRGRIQRQTA